MITPPSRITSKLTYSNLIASLALFIALGGAAVAAGLAKNSVGSKQLKANAVTAAKIKNSAVNSHKLAHGAVVAGKLGANSVSSGVLQNESVSAAKLAKNSVANAAIANGVVGTNKLGNNVVTTAKLADGSVSSAKLSGEIGPGTVSPLKSGQTLRGVFDVGGRNPANSPFAINGGVSYALPLTNAPTVTILKKGEKSANCGGLSGGNEQTPQATAGNLCVYLTTEANLGAPALEAENNTRLGFGLIAHAASTEGQFTAAGQWAVTAP